LQTLDPELYRSIIFENSPVVTTQQLTKQFGRAFAVNAANFEVMPGDVFGLLGPNGAGKTTIIRMLLGLIKPTGGQAKVFGFDTIAQRAEVLARVSAIVEAPALYPGLNGYNNLKAMAIASGIANPDQKIQEVLGRMGLSARAKDKFSTYSLGMKQRLCVAAALLTDPQLIILDEPTNGLDPAGMADIRTLIKDLASQGRTVLLSSHLLHEVQQVCNRVAIIQQGSIIVQGRVEELLAGKTSIYIHVQQHEWEKAWYVLQAAGYGARLRAEGEFLIVAGTAEDGVELNRVLATNEIYAGEISPRSQSLEEYYLSLTTHNMPYPMQPITTFPGGAYNGN
jgi:ABC-2 type transport system ATP-binding protein